MNLFESIADRRIADARRAGLFDDLPGRGKPIADLGRERPPGWWAMRVVRTERDKMRFEGLKDHLERAMPGLWRLQSEDQVVTRVCELNRTISEHNAATTFERVQPLSVEDTVRRWRGLRRPPVTNVGSLHR